MISEAGTKSAASGVLACEVVVKVPPPRETRLLRYVSGGWEKWMGRDS